MLWRWVYIRVGPRHHGPVFVFAHILDLVRCVKRRQIRLDHPIAKLHGLVPVVEACRDRSPRLDVVESAPFLFQLGGGRPVHPKNTVERHWEGKQK